MPQWREDAEDGDGLCVQNYLREHQTSALVPQHSSAAPKHALQDQPQPALQAPGHHQEEHVQPVIVSNALKEQLAQGEMLCRTLRVLAPPLNSDSNPTHPRLCQAGTFDVLSGFCTPLPVGVGALWN